jgi:hypothetical protein
MLRQSLLVYSQLVVVQRGEKEVSQLSIERRESRVLDWRPNKK